MDSGFLEAGDSLDDFYDVRRELTPKELMGVMDSLLCLEVSYHQTLSLCFPFAELPKVAWQMGNPLSITLFSSVYIDRILWPEPKDLESASFLRPSDISHGHPQPSLLQGALRAYCLGLIKACDLCLERVSRQSYFEV